MSTQVLYSKKLNIFEELLWPKNQFLFLFGFQNYVNWTVSDTSFKPWLKKDTCLFLLEFASLMVLNTNFKILREVDRGENDVKDSLVEECNACVRDWINMQHGSFGLSDF